MPQHLADALPAWRLWSSKRMTWTELQNASIDDAADAWDILTALGDAEERDRVKAERKQRK